VADPVLSMFLLQRRPGDSDGGIQAAAMENEGRLTLRRESASGPHDHSWRAVAD
jgi:hypothetical protein